VAGHEAGFASLELAVRGDWLCMKVVGERLRRKEGSEPKMEEEVYVWVDKFS